ncbi:hypothetical protein [Herbaspirillum sp. RV1423]|uniref:hypothetical protein n=1 Tax=Herbaspirillum sp. RV1423 TaxID=1443993 RepID=UPI0004B01318|nr:hypothetical protein [Herbaspirillum sp. RV1423]
MTTATELIDGIEVKMAGKTWVIPALSFKRLKQLRPKIAALAALNTLPEEEVIDDVCVIVHAAIIRNYPEVTLDEVQEMVDMSNMQRVIKAVMGQSGLVEKGEAGAGSR